ncbi:MAG: PspC domain-containing protein [Treponema sp.]|nr:PspC domain-containing protein [Treponema sp.]
MSKKRLCKSRKNKMIGGVCGGLAEYLNIDVTIIRIVAGVLFLAKGIGLLVYIVACIVMPFDDDDFSDDETENLKSANINPEDEDKAGGKKSSAKADKRMHSDEEFDSYFKK